MKTSVTMIRKMGDFDIYQRTGDGLFNANSLLRQYNKSKNLKRGKEVNDFLKLDKTKEFIEALKDELPDTTKIVSVNKGGNDKNNQGTWMHPLLFIDFAMWLNPTFKVQVLKFVYDELIKEPHEAGDNYLLLSSAGVRLKGYDFVQVAKAIQWIVFNKTGKELRQSATQEQLKEMNELQTKLAFAIDMKYISTYPQLIEEMKKIWRQKYRTAPF